MGNKELLAWQEDFQGYIKMLNLPRDDYKGIMEYINELPSAQPDLDSAYTEGYTAAESKYREMWDEMQFSKESTTSDCISRQDAIDLIEGIETERLKGNIELIYAPAIKGLRALQSAQPEPLTDKEQRIFLSAMEREEIVCKQFDDKHRNCREPYEDSLVSVCRNIMRKVKGSLWTT